MNQRKCIIKIYIVFGLFQWLVCLDLFSRNRAIYDNANINTDHVVLSSAVCRAECYNICQQKLHNLTSATLKNNGGSNQIMQRDTMDLSSNDLSLKSPKGPNSRLEDQCKEKFPHFIVSCIQSCQFSEKTGSHSLETCSDPCNKDAQQMVGCLAGCRLLLKASENALGSCPLNLDNSKNSNTDTQSKPINSNQVYSECHVDEECTATGGILRKCCQKKCVVPQFHPDAGPSLWPPNIMEGSDGLSFEMTWKFESSRFISSSSSTPILFVLQVRTHFNPEFETGKASRWKTLLVTFREGVRLQDLQPGMWYQFRVASVTKMGTRGFHTPSPPVRLSRLPKAPSPPRNLTDGPWRLRSNGKINININWLSPLTSDIPITEYKISWVRDHGFIQPDGQSLEALTDFVQTVPGTQRSYNIEGLLADKTYKAQIRAICKWGSNVFQSNPSTIFLTTPSLPRNNRNQMFTSDTVIADSDICICQNNIQSDSQLKIIGPFLQKSSLKVTLKILEYDENLAYRVSYSPRVCIDSDYMPLSSSKSVYAERSLTTGLSNVTLGPLHFSCRYHVTVQPLKIGKWKKYPPENIPLSQYSHQTDPVIFSTCFCTPSCSTFVKSTKSNNKNLKCINEGPSKSADDLNHSQKSGKTSKMSLEPPDGLYFQRSQKNPRSFLVFWKQHSVPNQKKNQYSDNNPINSFSLRYRVVWGPSIDEFSTLDLSGLSTTESDSRMVLMPRLDVSKAETKVLRQNVSSIWLENLQSNTFYVVQVQSILMNDESNQRGSILGSEKASEIKMIVLSTHDLNSRDNYKNVQFQKMNMQQNNRKSGTNRRINFSLMQLLLIAIYFSS